MLRLRAAVRAKVQHAGAPARRARGQPEGGVQVPAVRQVVLAQTQHDRARAGRARQAKAVQVPVVPAIVRRAVRGRQALRSAARAPHRWRAAVSVPGVWQAFLPEVQPHRAPAVARPHSVAVRVPRVSQVLHPQGGAQQACLSPRRNVNTRHAHHLVSYIYMTNAHAPMLSRALEAILKHSHYFCFFRFRFCILMFISGIRNVFILALPNLIYDKYTSGYILNNFLQNIYLLSYYTRLARFILRYSF